MKGCIPEINLEGQGCQKTLQVQIFLKMMEHQKKGVLKQKIESSLYTLEWGFKRIPFTLYTYVLAKILQNDTKFRYAKAGFKNYRNLKNFGQALESQKFDGLLSKKYIPSAKALYTVDLSNIIQHINYLCEDLPNYLCNF